MHPGPGISARLAALDAPAAGGFGGAAGTRVVNHHTPAHNTGAMPVEFPPTTAAGEPSQHDEDRVRPVPSLAVLFTPRLDQAGQILALTSGVQRLDRGALLVGGRPIEDSAISRRHGRIERTADGRFLVVDEGSRNGTWVRWKRLQPGEPELLAPGDPLRIGNTVLLFAELPPDPIAWECGEALARMRRDYRDRDARLAAEERIVEVHRALWRDELVGVSSAMRGVRRRVLAAARSEASVLVLGPTGTGKEAAARAVHRASRRSKGPFVPFSCAEVAPELLVAELFGAVKGAYTGADADRPGLWRTAHKGTLFLDELGDATPALQAALLRVIETGEVRPVGGTRTYRVDVRIVAATSRSLRTMVREGSFREDLYFRLAGEVIRIPPLADCREDAFVIFAAGLRRQGATHAVLGTELAEHLWRYPWPGNAREVIQLATRLAPDAASGRVLSLPADWEDPRTPTQTSFPSARTRIIPEEVVRGALDEAGGKVAQAARALGITRQRLYRLCERYGIDLTEFRT